MIVLFDSTGVQQIEKLGWWNKKFIDDYFLPGVLVRNKIEGDETWWRHKGILN